MLGFATCQISGYMASDVWEKTSERAGKFSEFVIAVNTQESHRDYFTIFCFGSLVPISLSHGYSGRGVVVSGYLRTSNNVSHDGTKRKRTYIVASNIQFF